MIKNEQRTASSADSSSDYQKQIRINAPAVALFDALTSLTGLAGWWARATGSGEAGGELKFFFDMTDPCVMHVDQATRPTLVRWTVTECRFLPEWVGTHPTFTITPDGRGACELYFRHEGLTPALDCIDVCTRGWNHFLASLHAYVELGCGSPFGSRGDNERRRNEGETPRRAPRSPAR